MTITNTATPPSTGSVSLTIPEVQLTGSVTSSPLPNGATPAPVDITGRIDPDNVTINPDPNGVSSDLYGGFNVHLTAPVTATNDTTTTTIPEQQVSGSIQFPTNQSARVTLYLVPVPVQQPCPTGPSDDYYPTRGGNPNGPLTPIVVLAVPAGQSISVPLGGVDALGGSGSQPFCIVAVADNPAVDVSVFGTAYATPSAPATPVPTQGN